MEGGKGEGESEGDGEESSIALDETVDWKRAEGSGSRRAAGAESDGGDGRDRDGDSSEGKPRASEVSGVRHDQGAAGATAAAAAGSGAWCSASPENGVLLPGEKLELRLTALVRRANYPKPSRRVPLTDIREVDTPWPTKPLGFHCYLENYAGSSSVYSSRPEAPSTSIESTPLRVVARFPLLPPV